MTRSRDISFVIPCLDEAATLPGVLARISEVTEGAFADRDTEVVVADNGSTDGSRKIARARGARVVDCPIRGYGAALRCGIEHARHDIVVFADADGTYDFGESPDLVAELERGHDLVVGSRIRGDIEAGAMPLLHRWLGTPILTLFLNLLHAGPGQRISDCNSGFRCLRRRAFAEWSVRGDGMEFASELLICALRSGARVSEVPVSLAADRGDRAPHLKRWRDGMRHLLTILAASPAAFFRTGLALWASSWAVLVVGLSAGPLPVGPLNLFGIHSMMFATLGSCVGLNLFGLGLLLPTSAEDVPVYARLLELEEGSLFWGSLTFLLASAAAVVPIFVAWADASYRFLALQKETLVWVALAANGVFLIHNLVAAHLIRR